MITAFPKIFSIGTDYIRDIFKDGPVEVTEKVDGCVVPGTKILTTDLRYVDVAELKAGDSIVGFDEELNRSRFRASTVTCAKPIEKECVEVFFTNGRSVVASIDHPFVVRFPKKTSTGLSKKYVEAAKLTSGKQVLSLGVWQHEESWESGYIAGQYDGEGSLVGPVKGGHRTRHLSYTQKDGDGADLVNDILIERGFTTSRDERKRQENWKLIQTVRVIGGWCEMLRFLGVFRPQRLLRDYFDKILNGVPMNGVKTVEVDRIEPVGIRLVIGLSTSTKTYVADGLLSHNSQFAFGRVNGELVMRSKGKVLHREAPEKMFNQAVAYVESIAHRLPDGMAFYCEYLQKPKHNVLTYSRVPKNHLMLFGVKSVAAEKFNGGVLKHWADELDIEAIPVLRFGGIKSSAELAEIIQRESILGRAMIEGVVVKNYSRQFLLGGQPIPLMAGKYVSEAFKEVHRANWKGDHTGKGKLETFFDSYRTEARWQKAVQHLRDNGDLLHDPKDIGRLIKEIHQDIEAEEEGRIKDWLYANFIGDLKRTACKGMPEWYKEQLLARAFDEAA